MASKLKTYILLDRSGSMNRRWEETLTAMNAYVKDLAETTGSKTTRATMAVFDGFNGLRFNVLRQDVAVKEWKPLTTDEAAPAGMTPLYDAIGRMVSIMEEDKPERAVLVIMTDGAENQSREMTKVTAKAALDRCKERGWAITFIGADFDAMSDAQSVGVGGGQTISTKSGFLSETMSIVAEKTRRYAGATGQAIAGSGAQDFMSYNASDRERAEGKAPKKSGKGIKETGV